MKRLSLTEIRKRLPSTVKYRGGEYLNQQSKLTFYCTVCRTSWETRARQAMKGCKHCNLEEKANRRLKYSSKEFDSKLPKNVQRLTDFRSLTDHCTFKCKVCNNQWTTQAHVALDHQCPFCARQKTHKAITKTHKQYVQELGVTNPEIEVLGRYVNSHTGIRHKHTVCGYTWVAKPLNLNRPGGEARGCPNCRLKTRQVQLGSRTVHVRGYEDLALNYMLTLFKPSQIAVQNEGRVPEFRYQFRGSSRVYYPDMYLKHLKTIVEVKSISTIGLTDNFFYKKPSHLFYETRAKCLKVKSEGFKFKLLIMTPKGTVVPIPKDWYTLSYREFKCSVLPYRP